MKKPLIIDLFYGVLTEGQAEELFTEGKPAADAFEKGADLVRLATSLPVLDQGKWVPTRRHVPAQNPLDLAPMGHIDYELPTGTARVNFIRP